MVPNAHHDDRHAFARYICRNHFEICHGKRGKVKGKSRSRFIWNVWALTQIMMIGMPLSTNYFEDVTTWKYIVEREVRCRESRSLAPPEPKISSRTHLEGMVPNADHDNRHAFAHQSFVNSSPTHTTHQR